MQQGNKDTETFVRAIKDVAGKMTKPGSPELMKLAVIRGIEATSPLTSGGMSRGTQREALRLFGVEMSMKALRDKTFLKGKDAIILEKDIAAGMQKRPQIVGGKLKIEVQMTMENIRKMPLVLNNPESNKVVATALNTVLKKFFR